MFGFLSPRKRWPIGLDIGTESVKMLQLCESAGAVVVRAAQHWRFAESADIEPAQRRRQASEAISEMLRTGGFAGREVVSALSCSQLSIKNVRLPHMPSDELAKAVAWEARERFDFNVRDDQVGFIDAGEVRQGGDMRSEIILMAAPAETVTEHLEILEQAGLSPMAIDAAPVAVFRAFERFLRRRADEEAVSVLIDIGHSSTRVVVARGRRIVFIKSIDIGGKRLTDAVAGQLNLSYCEARDLRMQSVGHGDADGKAGASTSRRSSIEWTVYDAVRGEAEALAKEISLCLRYCSVTFRGLRPTKVILIGGEAYDQTLVAILNDQLGLECSVGRALRGFDTSKVDLGGDRRATAAEWALCTGLAIRNSDFSGKPKEEDREQHRLSA
ncbi:MAG: pilus assembly protein PilM [Planctomycetes bacterium]|nr:pilus assembly protein PilM [Planctomycetota bacterium]